MGLECEAREGRPGMILLGVGVLILTVVVATLLLPPRDPISRAAEHAEESGDDTELVALIKLRYGQEGERDG